MTPISKIQKRNLQIVPFEPKKIQIALQKAATTSRTKDFSADEILTKTLSYLEIFFKTSNINPTTAQLKDLLLKVLLENHHGKIAEIFEKKYPKPAPISANVFFHIFPPQSFTTLQKQLFPGRQLLENTNKSLENYFTEITKKITSENHDKFLNLLVSKHFLLNKNYLRGIPAPTSVHITLENHQENFFETLKRFAKFHQAGIHVSLDFSEIGAKKTTSENQTNLGPVAALKLFLATLETLNEVNKNDTKHTFILKVEHPDLIEFLIFAKKIFENYPHTKGHLEIVIQLTKRFFDSLKNAEHLELWDPETQQILNVLNAESLLDLLLATMSEHHHLQFALPNISQQLPSNYAIISGSLNLSSFLTPLENHENLTFDFKKFQKIVLECTEILQQLKQEQENFGESFTKLNLTGFAEMLIGLKIGYNSVKCLQLCEEILTQLQQITNGKIQTSVEPDEVATKIWALSPGIEPLSHLVKTKQSLDGKEIYFAHQLLERALQDENLFVPSVLKMLSNQTSIQNLLELPEKLRQVYVTSSDLSPELHTNIQIIFEKFLTGKVRKKLSFSQTPSLEHLKELLLTSYESGAQSMGQLEIHGFDQNKYTNSKNQEKRFLMNYSNMSKNIRRLDLQPQLFQVKKTEEISLPPIHSIPQQ